MSMLKDFYEDINEVMCKHKIYTAETLDKKLTALDIISKYADVDDFKGLTNEQKEILKEVL